MNKTYSDKQLALLRDWQQGKLRRLTLLEGSVRSGKTWISLVLWAFWVATMPRGGSYLMVAKTLTSLKRNCLDLLESLVGKNNFSYSLSQKEGRLFGRRIYFEGVNDVRAEGKIRGMTLQGAYCDELTLFTEDFFTMLLSRLSEAGAKLFATTNPDTPSHWLMQRFILRRDELDIDIIKFLLEDNSFLDPGYVAALKQEYTGVYYERFILGQWVVAEGAVYRVFSENIKSFITAAPQYDYCSIGVDIGGNKSAHAFVASGIKNDGSLLTALMSRRRAATGTTPEDFYRLFDAFLGTVIQKYGTPQYIFVDSAEQMIINGLRARYGAGTRYNIAVRGSDKERILERVRVTTMLMSQQRFQMTADCQSLAEAFQGAVYSDKAEKDERLDNGTSDIDTLDAFEYSWEKEIRKYSRLRQERDKP